MGITDERVGGFRLCFGVFIVPVVSVVTVVPIVGFEVKAESCLKR